MSETTKITRDSVLAMLQIQPKTSETVYIRVNGGPIIELGDDTVTIPLDAQIEIVTIGPPRELEHLLDVDPPSSSR